jgi:ribonucleoside-diphosphate reductase beta chain
LWDYFKKQQQAIWTAEELDLSRDTFEGIPDKTVSILKHLLGFFGVSDSIVQDNLADEIISEFSSIEEIKSNYVYQAYIEDVHSETYSRLIEQLIKDDREKFEMFNAIKTNPIVAEKVKWAKKWLENGSLIQRVVAFSLVEGMAFSSTFAFLMFFRQKYPQLAGLGQANELILIDELMHMNFAILLYNKYIKDDYKLPQEEIREMILDCYNTEKLFVESIYEQGDVIGLPKEKMLQYVQYVADNLLYYYQLPLEFNVSQPLDFMSNISLVVRQNFFESKSGAYQKLENMSGDLFNEDF